MRIAVITFCVVLSLAACGQTPKMEESPGAEADPFFLLDLQPGPMPAPVDDGRLARPDAKAVELRFRFLSDGILLTSPVLTVGTGERSEIRLANQVSYISDFNVEVQQDAFVADPVISMLQDGLLLRTVAVPAADGRTVALTWRLRLSRIDQPIRTREILIGGTEPVLIQFPAVRSREAAGRTLLDMGVETALVRISGERPVTVFVSAVPVDMPAAEAPVGIELIPGGKEPSAEVEPDALLDGAAGRKPPERGQRLALVIGRYPGPALTRPLHLDHVAGAIFMTGVEVLRQTSAAAAAEAGSGVTWLQETSYHRDSKPHETGVRDPEVDVARIGFEGRFDVRDGEQVLDFQYAALTGIQDVMRKRDGVEFPVERPNMVTKRGVLRLRGAVDVMPLGTLKEGGTVVLVVRRDVPR